MSPYTVQSATVTLPTPTAIAKAFGLEVWRWGTMPVQRSGFGTLTIKKPRVFGRRSPDTQLVGTIQEQERSGLGILTTTNPRMLGTQPKTNVRLFGMLQEIDKN
jgi:hypothetical protein